MKDKKQIEKHLIHLKSNRTEILKLIESDKNVKLLSQLNDWVSNLHDLSIRISLLEWVLN